MLLLKLSRRYAKELERRVSKKANKEYRRAYVANLAENLSVVDEEEEKDEIEVLEDPSELIHSRQLPSPPGAPGQEALALSNA